MTDGERLKKLIDTTHMSVRKFSKQVGLNSPQILYNVLHGKNKITNDVADTISLHFSNINKDWLLRGEGEMYIEEEKKIEGDDYIPLSVLDIIKENQKEKNHQIETLLTQQQELIDIIKNQQELIEKQSCALIKLNT